MPAPPVDHNEPAQRFEIPLHPRPAVLTYRRGGGWIAFLHTAVPRSHRGEGLGGALVRAGLDYAREERLRVRPYCPFVAAFIHRHPEFEILVDGRA